jgi:hypothetical protein
MIFEVDLELILQDEGESVLQEPADFSSVLPVPVTDREEVAVTESEEVRARDVGVLVDLVRVVRREPSLGSEGELGHNVRDLRGGCPQAFVSCKGLGY